MFMLFTSFQFLSKLIILINFLKNSTFIVNDDVFCFSFEHLFLKSVIIYCISSMVSEFEMMSANHSVLTFFIYVLNPFVSN